MDVIKWAKRGQELGAGEILLTSVEREGTAKGFDVDLLKAVTDVVTIPVIASGGMGKPEDIDTVVNDGHADAVAMAHVLHYEHYQLSDIRNHCIEVGIPVRTFSSIGEF